MLTGKRGRKIGVKSNVGGTNIGAGENGTKIGRSAILDNATLDVRIKAASF